MLKNVTLLFFLLRWHLGFSITVYGVFVSLVCECMLWEKRWRWRWPPLVAAFGVFCFLFFFCCECVSVLVIFFFCLFVSVSRLVLLFPCNKSFFFSFFLCFSLFALFAIKGLCFLFFCFSFFSFWENNWIFAVVVCVCVVIRLYLFKLYNIFMFVSSLV